MFPLPLVITSHSSKVRLLDFFYFFSDVPASASHQKDRVSRAPSSELLKEYRKVDDAVTTRINRTTAQFRDRDRLGASGKGSVQEQACAYLWKELVGARGQNPIITRRLDVFHGPSQLETPS
jgi:hypothetical protein